MADLVNLNKNSEITNKRYKSIDFIKGIAMIMVILVHYEQMFRISKLFYCFGQGCAIFFVASGFGIASLINKKYNGALNKDNISKFFISRINALYPGWLIAFILVFTANTLALYFLKMPLNFGKNRGIVSIICNLLFLNGLLPFCNNNVMPGGWYIGTTALLYAVTPLIFKSLNKAKNKVVFFLLSSTVSVAVWAILYFLLIKWFNIPKGFSEHIFFVQYPCYLSGIILYKIIKSKQYKSKPHILIFIIGILASVIALAFFYIPYFWGYYTSIWFMSFGMCLVLYYSANRENDTYFFDSIFARIIIAFGKKSYSIYLTHSFIVYIFVFAVEKFTIRLGFSIKNILGFLILLPITIALSYLLGHLFSVAVNLFNKLKSKIFS